MKLRNFTFLTMKLMIESFISLNVTVIIGGKMAEEEPIKLVTFKCEDGLFLRLEEEAKKANVTKTKIIREALAKLLQHDIDEIRELSRGTPPYSGKRVVSIRLPESLNTQLEIAAEKISTNKSDLIRTAIVAYFKLV